MIKNITVVGAGTMGHGIAHVFARKGYNVSIYEPFEAVREQAMEKISGELQFMVDEDYITAEEKEETLKHIKIYDQLVDAAKDADYVIEACPEKWNSNRSFLRHWIRSVRSIRFLQQILPA